MNTTTSNDTYGRYGIPFGIYSIARLAHNNITSYRAEGDGWNHNSFLAGGYGTSNAIGFTGAGTPCLNHLNHPSCSGAQENWPNAFRAGKWLNVVWVRRVMESSAMIDNNSPLKYAFSGNKLYVFADGSSYQKEGFDLATCPRGKTEPPIIQPKDIIPRRDRDRQPPPDKRRPEDGRTTCLLAGTKILTKNDASVNIEDVKVGDEVFGLNEKTAQTKLVRVAEVFKHENTSGYYRIILENGTRLEITGNHPVYIASDACKRTDELKVNYTLFTERGSIKITRIEFIPESSTVYNFEVSDTHNYFANGVLVHNKTPPPPKRREDDQPIEPTKPTEPTKPSDEPKQPEPPADLGRPEIKPPEQMPPIWPPPQGGQSGNDALYINGQAWQRGAFQDQGNPMTGKYNTSDNYLRLGEVMSTLRLNGAPDATIDEVLIFELAPTSQGSSINPPSDRKSAGNDTFIIDENIKLCSLKNTMGQNNILHLPSRISGKVDRKSVV
jgi:hypothetical protein